MLGKADVRADFAIDCDRDPLRPLETDKARVAAACRQDRVARWLLQRHTKTDLASAALALSPLMGVMQRLFESVRREDEVNTVLPFCNMSTNPAVKLIDLLFKRLGDELDPYWLPVREHRWTHYARKTAGSSIYKVFW